MAMNSPKYLRHFCYAAAAFCLVSVWGCKDDQPTVDPPKPAPWDQGTADVLKDLTQNVMLPIVRDFDQSAADLLTAITALRTQKSEQALSEARTAWVKSRGPWEVCEAFLFGPAKNQQIDPAVDAWPLDEITLDSMLRSNDQLTKEYFDQSEGTVKGSHALEYLLWGQNGNKTINDFTDREFDFLVACCSSFREETARLKKAWVPSTEGGDNYAEQLYNAGKAGSLYSTQAAGVREVIGGLVMIMTELDASKMGIPFTQRSTDFEEARFSGNSKADFLANVAGVQYIYEGNYGTNSGKGLSDLVRAKSTQLDDSIKAQLQIAVQRINEITPTFGDAVFNNRNSIQTARFAVSVIATLFDKDVREKLGLTQ